MDKDDLIIDSLKGIQTTLSEVVVKVTRIEDSSKAHAKDIEDIKDNCSKCQERIDKLEDDFAKMKQIGDTAVSTVKFVCPRIWTVIKYVIAAAGGAGGLEVIRRTFLGS